MNQNSVIVKCGHCGARNRIPKTRLNDRAVCGKCRTPLSLAARYPEHTIDVWDHSFRDEVLDFPGAVAAYFWSHSCGYCRVFSPMVNQLATRYAGRVKFVKVLLDRNPATASQYSVMSVPSLLLFKGGREVDRITGTVSQDQVERRLRALM